MSHSRGTAPGSEPRHGDDESTGQLVSRFSQDVSELVRNELRLAQVEVTGKAKSAGKGIGMFGGAGLLALYGGGALIATAIVALAMAMPAWLACLLVAVVLLAAGGVVALLGRSRIETATPPVPERAMDNLKRDVEAVRPRRDRHEA